MEIIDQIPSIRAFMSFGLPPLFDLEEPNLFAGAAEATRDSFDPAQRNQVLGALSYQISAAVLSSSIFQQPRAASSFFGSFSSGSSSRTPNLTESFLLPSFSFSLSTPDGPLSVGDLIDLFG